MTESLPAHIRGALGPWLRALTLLNGGAGYGRKRVEILLIQCMVSRSLQGLGPCHSTVCLALPLGASDLLSCCLPGRHTPTLGPLIFLFLYLMGSYSPDIPNLLLSLCSVRKHGFPVSGVSPTHWYLSHVYSTSLQNLPPPYHSLRCFRVYRPSATAMCPCLRLSNAVTWHVGGAQ